MPDKLAGIAGEEVLGLLAHLVEKSLIVVEEARDGTTRYRLLGVLRLYGRERAQEAGELPALEQRHRDWCLALAEAVPPEQLDPQHIARLAQEQDNLRAALRWTIARGETEAGLRLGVAAWPLWYVRGLYAEGRAWLAELLALPGAASATRARALTWAGHLAYCQGDYTAAQARLEEALATARGLGAEQEVAVALLFLAHIPRNRGDLQRAEGLYQEALGITRRLGHRVWEVFTLNNLALLAEQRGDAAGAEALGTEALAVARAVGHQPAIAGMLGLLGRDALGRGEYATARQLLEESAALQRAQGFQQALAWSSSALAQVAVAEGDAALAGRLLAEGLALARDTGDLLAVARGLEGVAALVEPGRPERAVRLAAAAAALREALGADLLPAERARLERWQAAATRALGKTAYAEAWSQGCRQSWEQATTEALVAAEAAAATARELMPAADAAPLTPREREIAVLLAQGLTNRQIAEALVISEGTARIHAEHVLGKLALHSRVQVAAWAREHGLLAEDT